ncbi:3-hydroxyacyl-CoA dehydrogenase [Candidatus Thermokryptus mobilis]|uniref:3-hydroxyacyl-CoA dehydrogenase n=1 Tax=Candidatus Thermokryptus mobilis TaxID=1643428 RepID=A0A0S4MPM6_9BACT|nr:3-hydroxyacyl-CoA dehydrogenase/enoyl-CoA hydratase family protein [Candidatus Thermokryptus mobilis]CUU01010.1 3-hydroxyacyl-CoA dehydrogenase [Candidatus Thermokryptus mobilis]
MRPIKKVAVLGAGVMGAQIAAHLANAGIPSYLLDIVPQELTEEEKRNGLTLQSPEVRNRIAREGLERAKKIKPNAFFIPELEKLITIGNFEDNLDWIKDVDWVIEAVVERLDIKRELFKKVEMVRRPGTIVSSNTSGIRISEIAEGFSDDFRKHFLGTHFFNPPRYMKLLEIIPTNETLPEVIETIAEFGEKVLGKGIVYCKDTPNFIANRIGVLAVMYVLHYMLQNNFTIEEVDELTGPVTGKPKSATFRTLDIVGLDTLVHVANNLYNAVPDDEMREYFKVPDVVQKMIENKWLGEKSGQGFYKRVKKADGESEILTLDFSTMEYRPRQKVKIGSLEMAKTVDDLRDKIKILMESKDKAGKFFWNTTSAVLAYASNRIPEISDTIVDIDNAMKWGFNWEVGPFELWDLIGVERSIEKIESEGFKVADWVKDMVNSGKKSFYQKSDGEIFFYDVAKKDYSKLRTRPEFINLALLKEDKRKVIKQNAGASLVDIGDGVICFEFHTKANAIGEDILVMANYAIEELEKNYEALVIGNQGQHFSAGANLMLILMLAQEGEWDEIDRAVRMFQQMNMRIKYASKPVVVAPHGMTLGGGCEIVLHAPRVRAYAESYIGLVEIGAGVIPAGGGTKEMLLRAIQKAPKSVDIDLTPFIREAFETIAYAKVSTSALEAKKLGYLREYDSISMNKDFLIHDAKKIALAMVEEGYKPPLPPEIIALGKQLYANFLVAIYLMREANYITEYEAHIGRKLAYVMSGGDLTSPQVVSEQYILDLEREAFLSLCGEKKTQERMQYILKYGKPLRN